MTTALMSSGKVVKNASMPRTTGGLKAFRFSGRFSFRSAISSWRSAMSEAGNSQCGQAVEDFASDIYASPASLPHTTRLVRRVNAEAWRAAASKAAEARETRRPFARRLKLVLRRRPVGISDRHSADDDLAFIDAETCAHHVMETGEGRLRAGLQFMRARGDNDVFKEHA